jgi:Exopolyphosphatase-related proteins
MLNKVIKESLIQDAKKLIDKYEKMVILTHVSPDGDALGSSLGLSFFLTELGNSVNVVVPNDFPPFLAWMPGAKDIVVASKKPALAAEVIEGAELIFCLDFNTLPRIAQLQPLVEQSEAKKILIDHHLDPDDIFDVTISYPEISSTSELIFRFICRQGLYHLVTEPCAECIYTGMMTDTGAFTFNSNSPYIYYIISELLKKGIDKDAIYSKVYNTYTESRVRLQGYLLYEKLKIYKEYGTALMTLTNSEKNKFGWKKGDTEGFVNIPLTIEEVIFSAFIREDEKDMVRISFRSKGDFPTNEFAAKVYGGGGHLNASGGEFYGKIVDAVKLFEEALPGFMEELT